MPGLLRRFAQPCLLLRRHVQCGAINIVKKSCEVGAFELNNGLFAAAPKHPLVAFLCEHVALPWPEWGEEDVDRLEAVAYQLQRPAEELFICLAIGSDSRVKCPRVPHGRGTDHHKHRW